MNATKRLVQKCILQYVLLYLPTFNLKGIYNQICVLYNSYMLNLFHFFMKLAVLKTNLKHQIYFDFSSVPLWNDIWPL